MKNMKEKPNINQEAWISLAMEKYESMLLSYAFNVCGSYERAQDIVQDTFLKLCKADMQKVDTYIKAWLFKVCRNRALEVIRKECKMQPLTDEQLNREVSTTSSPYDQIDRSEQFSQMLSLVEELPEKQKEVVFLKFQSELSYKEISEVADISISNVGVILHTAIGKLRTQMRTNSEVQNVY